MTEGRGTFFFLVKKFVVYDENEGVKKGEGPKGSNLHAAVCSGR